MLVLLLEDCPNDAEIAMPSAGHTRRVLGDRQVLHEIIEPKLTAAVQRATGRAVRPVFSATCLDPDLSVAVFLLDDSVRQAPAANMPAGLRERAAATRAL
jgi:hypothetical protein